MKDSLATPHRKIWQHFKPLLQGLCFAGEFRLAEIKPKPIQRIYYGLLKWRRVVKVKPEQAATE